MGPSVFCRGHPKDRPKVVDEVGLVEVPETHRQFGPVDPVVVLEDLGGLLEAEPAEHPLGAHAHVAVKPALELPNREAGAVGDLVHPGEVRVVSDPSHDLGGLLGFVVAGRPATPQEIVDGGGGSGADQRYNPGTEDLSGVDRPTRPLGRRLGAETRQASWSKPDPEDFSLTFQGSLKRTSWNPVQQSPGEGGGFEGEVMVGKGEDRLDVDVAWCKVVPNRPVVFDPRCQFGGRRESTQLKLLEALLSVDDSSELPRFHGPSEPQLVAFFQDRGARPE